MADTHVVTQFSVFLVNKPGVLAQVAKGLADERVNLVAMTIAESQEHGVLRLVAEDATAARRVLGRLNLPTTETDVVSVELSNRPGALAGVATLLAENHININYAYATSGAPGGKTTGIFKVSDVAKAQKRLKGSSAKHREPNLGRGVERR